MPWPTPPRRCAPSPHEIRKTRGTPNTSRARRRSRPPQVLVANRDSSFPRVHRQVERKLRAALELAFEDDFAAEHGRQSLADRQSQPGSAVLSRRRVVHLTEVFKHFALVLRRDADAGVSDADGDPLLLWAVR